ncbi:MAG: L-fucose/L-arabinose isomerase family protein [Spirochaetes bacterium]|nr:L-fucose/L-arabinose isomerase family protein [Spirochaetota bacterium]
MSKNPIERKKPRTARVGLFGVGHQIYWSQFEGLLPNLMGYHEILKKRLQAMGVEVVDIGMVDTSQAAYAAAAKLRSGELDLLFCNMLTYATSSVFAPILRDVPVPMVLVALQPKSALDYTKASTFMQLENDNICSVPEFTGVAVRLNRKIHDVVIGKLHDDPKADGELAAWCDVAKVLHDLRGARIGLMGHVLEAMYDMHADPTAVSAAFGVHVPLLEIDDLMACAAEVTEGEVKEKIRVIESLFDFPDPKSDPVTRKLTPEDLEQAAKSACALDRLTAKFELTGLAYYYDGLPDSPQRKLATTLMVGNSILLAQGFPMCGEFDLKTNLAMLIMDRMGIGGSFAEFHPFDFDGDFILVGHDGPHHLAIAEGKPVLRSLTKYHGKPGSGAGVEFKIKEGPLTMLGITQKADGGFKFVIGEGESRKGPIPPTGNTNTRGFFPPNTRDFIKAWVMQGPTHHYALGIGHHAKTLEKIAGILGIEAVVVKA